MLYFLLKLNDEHKSQKLSKHNYWHNFRNIGALLVAY